MLSYLDKIYLLTLGLEPRVTESPMKGLDTNPDFQYNESQFCLLSTISKGHFPLFLDSLVISNTHLDKKRISNTF